MFELLFALLLTMADCSIDVVGTAEVYFIAHYEHAAPSSVPSDYYDVGTWRGVPNYECKYCSVSSLNQNEIDKHVTRHTRKIDRHFTYRSPRYEVTDDTIELTADWYPVAYQWIVKEKDDREFTVAKTCGDVPHPCLCSPWDGLVTDPEACTYDAKKKSEVYLIGYYLHESPEIPGIRYIYESKPVRYKDDETVEIDWQGEPVAVEWFMKRESERGFSPAGVCGTVPE
jgi:hypothetical protein